MTSRRVLVVDDEPVIHELVREVLDDYEILSALTIGEAHGIVRTGAAFDVALLDKNLPDGSGVELVGWVRARRPSAEIVMMTAYPSIDSALEVMSLGACDYLIKPLRNINELRLRVGNACERVERRRAEASLDAALRESEERYRELFEASPDAVLVIDEQSRAITAANSAAERLYGRGRDELVTLRLDTLVSPACTPTVQNGVVRRQDLRADGTSVPVEVTAGTARASGRAQVIEVIRDVSERERAEAERRELEKRLARNGRLEALGRMAAGIAHDVNNLLCVILTNTEMATETLGGESIVATDLAQIEAAVHSAADLTRRLLTFSGRQMVREQVLDLNVVVQHVVKLVQRTFEARVRLALELSPAPLHVRMDQGQLEQVIANLAVNARDAMHAGGTLTIATSASASSMVRVVVRDTGVGIPPEVVANIFEPFFTTKGSAGTGLGLATVHEIVTRQQGTIDVVSRLGEGTEFIVDLPRSSEDPPRARAAVSLPVLAGRGEAILLVEDDLAVRDATRRLLAKAGYAVCECGTLADARRIAAERPIQLVLADVDLPDGSGFDLGRTVAEPGSATRVLYTSGMASDAGTQAEGRFLPKPYSADELLRTVRRVLDHP